MFKTLKLEKTFGIRIVRTLLNIGNAHNFARRSV